MTTGQLRAALDTLPNYREAGYRLLRVTAPDPGQGYSDISAYLDYEFHFHYAPLRGEGGTPGLEVGIIAFNGDVIGWQDFG